MDSVGARIKKIRGSLSRETFAKKYGIHRNTLERYENGARKVPEAFLFQLAECEQLWLKWVQTGEGPMYKTPSGDTESKISGSTTCDSVAGSADTLQSQPIENITSEKNKTCDMSQVSFLVEENKKVYQKIIELQERLFNLSEDKAKLQVSLERAMMDVERRDMRIRELEKENAKLKEAQKGAARAQNQMCCAGA